MKFWQSFSGNVADVPLCPSEYSELSSIEAAVNAGNRHMKRCIISNLNLSGMYLEMRDADFAAGTELEVLFFCDTYGNTKRCSETVRVVQVDGLGVAVEFTCFDNQHQSNIQNMMHQMHQVPQVKPPTHGVITGGQLHASQA